MILKIAGPLEFYQNPNKDKDIDWEGAGTISGFENARRKISGASTLALGGAAGYVGHHVAGIKGSRNGKTALITAGAAGLGLAAGHGMDRLGHKNLRRKMGKSVNKNLNTLDKKEKLNDTEKNIKKQLLSFRENNPNLFKNK